MALAIDVTVSAMPLLSDQAGDQPRSAAARSFERTLCRMSPSRAGANSGSRR